REGRIMLCRLVARSWEMGTHPVAGNQCRPTANTATMMGAITNGGRANNPKVPVVATLSWMLLGRREVIRARGMATPNAMTWEMTMSSRSMGQPVAMMWVTDSWSR